MLRKSEEHPRRGSSEDDHDLNRRYGEYRHRVACYVRKNFPDVCADDVAQVSIERLLRNRYDQDTSRSIDSLLFTIAANIVRDLRRRRWLASQLPPGRQGPSPVVSPEEQVIDNENKRLASHAFQLLAPSDQQVIKAVDLDDIRCVDLSALEGVSYAAMRKRLSRARRRLFEHFVRLSRAVLPLVLVAEALRWLRGNAQTAMFAGATGVATVAAAVSLAPGLAGPNRDGDVDDVFQAPPASIGTVDASLSPSVSEAPPVASKRAGTTAVPDAARHTRVGTSRPSEPDDATAPFRATVDVSAGTGAGRKQENAIAAETPLGPVGTDGASHATGPASMSSGCVGQEPTSVPDCGRSPRMTGADSSREDPADLNSLRMAER